MQLDNNILNIHGVSLSPLNIIDVEGGNIYHALKKSDTGYCGFGEAYFSEIKSGVIKAWKRHQEMTLNLIVPFGCIRFVAYDDREDSSSYGKYGEVSLSRDNYFRLTLPPLLWMGFQGVSKHTSMLLNVANIEHRASEADRKEQNEINYNWEICL